ncbi:MAG: RdgB/HAM1 family non-canonical purine NTP pyrophosphatase [Gammaproteobacteria bacterium]|nr:RdgB/HAM1 family non-canonical purine NTP pyrophosphatase [Gammaproteobacteria bacterium]
MNRKVVLASGNAGKLAEFGQSLAPLGIELIPQSQFVVTEAEETGLSFVENAIIKARHACAASGLPALADDSGLEVDYLSGQPGIYSSRFAGLVGPHKDAANNAKLLAELARVAEPQRSARFQCVLVYMRHANDPVPLICQAAWEGSILKQAQGLDGFGYDPLFAVAGMQCSAAELSKTEKMAVSHRGQALKQLIVALK